jgi:hypothetical protein
MFLISLNNIRNSLSPLYSTERDTQSSRENSTGRGSDFFLDFRFQRCPPGSMLGNTITNIASLLPKFSFRFFMSLCHWIIFTRETRVIILPLRWRETLGDNLGKIERGNGTARHDRYFKIKFLSSLTDKGLQFFGCNPTEVADVLSTCAP